MKKVQQIFLEVTNKCTACCTTCLNKTMHRERGVMLFDNFTKCIDEIVKHELATTVHLYGFGEPYLTPNYLDYCNYAIHWLGTKSITTNIITNGSVMTEIPYGLTNLNISFNAGKKKTYEKITGLDFDRTYNNICRLYHEGQFRKVLTPVEIHFLKFEENKNEVDDFFKLFCGFKGVQLRVATKYDNQRGLIEDETIEGYKESERIPCHYVKNVLNVTWNGDVSACPHDEDNKVVYGNAFDKSLRDCIVSQKRGEMLWNHNRGCFEGICERCNFNVNMDGKYEYL